MSNKYQNMADKWVVFSHKFLLTHNKMINQNKWDSSISSLSIVDHHDEMFLYVQRKFMPIALFIQRLTHFQIAFRCQFFTEKTQKQVNNGNRCGYE